MQFILNKPVTPFLPIILADHGVSLSVSASLIADHFRSAWLKDVRTEFERPGIGWAMWDYFGSFGAVMKKDGQATPD